MSTSNSIPYREGDKSKGICAQCEGIVDITFMAACDVINCVWESLELVSVCDNCGMIVGIPHQSISMIKEQDATDNSIS